MPLTNANKTDAIEMAVAGRKPKQKRSQETRDKITEASIQLLATKGIAGLNHRLVAKSAGVSLSSTTYYFNQKSDIVGIASNQILQGYSDAFAAVAKRYLRDQNTNQGVGELIARIVQASTGKHSLGTLAWAEITLDAARNQDSLTLSKKWHDRLMELWTDITKALGTAHPAETARSGIDLTVGFLFISRALGLSADQVDDVFVRKADPLVAWAVEVPPGQNTSPKSGTPSRGKKSDQTRQVILDAAIELLNHEGTASITHRKIAQLAGLTPAAPSYHFKSIDLLLRAAQEQLFESSKQRMHDVIADVDLTALDADQLIDITTMILQREATENGANNLASLAIWVEAARRPELRPMVWSGISDQMRGWNQLLQAITPAPRPIDALLLQAAYTGKLIRLLSTGARNSDLVLARKEIAFFVTGLIKNDLNI
jgi:DNA-binding transcriptional regulator YbjK